MTKGTMIGILSGVLIGNVVIDVSKVVWRRYHQTTYELKPGETLCVRRNEDGKYASWNWVR